MLNAIVLLSRGTVASHILLRHDQTLETSGYLLHFQIASQTHYLLLCPINNS